MIWKFPLFRRKKINKELRGFLLKTLHISISDTALYEQAFRHSSAAEKISPALKDSNERLEFLGDSILDSIVAHYLYDKYPMLPEGELSKMKSKVVRRENLNMIGYTLGLNEQISLNLGRQEMHHSIVGNAVEALIGAMYIDKGYNVTRDIVLSLLKQHGLDIWIHDDVDSKSRLHEWSQKYKRTLAFRVLSHQKVSGASFYRIVVYIDGSEYGIGEGASKKAAEQQAARQACEKIFV
ncbi:MAG: ribonuclease III [Crocinitomicaceae bacterium]|nr:ribonuclease III [Crocinitomicaceae bacterium]